MEEEKKKQIDVIEDFFKVLDFLKMLWGERKLFYKTCGCAIVVALVIAFSIPKRYSAEVVLAPEVAGENSLGGLSSLASMTGINLGTLGNNDAIGPDLYPTLVHSKDYLVRLFDVPVTFEVGDSMLTTSYYKYLFNYQKIAWWNYPSKWLGDLMNVILPSKEEKKDVKTADGQRNFMYLSKKERGVIGKMQGNISCSQDKKTGIISISVVAQDPVVAAVIADSARVALNEFIIEYRTGKARQDCQYMTKVYEEAKSDYRKAQAAYAAYADANMNLSTRRGQAMLDDLQNEMQLAYGVYSQVANQLQLVKAKVQESTPVYTIIESATIPEKASSPKKILMLVAFVFLAGVGTTGWIFLKKQGIVGKNK